MAKAKKAVTQLAEANGFISGLTSSPPPNVKSVNVTGDSYTVAQLITEAQGVVEINQAVVDTRAKWKAAVAAAKAATKSNRMLLTGIRRGLVQAYGSDVAGLAACGIVVTPPTPRSSATNTVAAAKAARTREVNGTGKKTPAPKPSITVTDVNGQVISQPASAPVVASASVAAPVASSAPSAAPASSNEGGVAAAAVAK